MTVTLADLCAELHNYDFNRRAARYHGVFRVSDGQIDLSELVADGSVQVDQYIRVIGSVFNDGVYQYGTDTLPHDEEFDGQVWALNVPHELVSLLGDINAWVTANAEQIATPYASESFGGYSYSLKSGLTGAGSDSGEGAWKSQFKTKLNRWRKMP